MKGTITIITLVMALTASIDLNAQKARTYTVTSGLISSQVEGIFQDSEGYIWITSGFGLVRYDGNTFESFHHDDNEDNSISCDNAHIVFEDSKGTIWIGTEHGMNIYDFDNNSFYLEPEPLKEFDIVDIHEFSSNGESYIISRSKPNDITVINAETHIVDTIKTEAISSICNDRVSRLYVDTTNHLWTSNGIGGIQCIDLTNMVEIPLLWSERADAYKKRMHTVCFIEDEDNSDIYIGTANDGIFIVDRESYLISKAGKDNTNNPRINVLSYNGRDSSSKGKYLLVGTEGEGLQTYNLEEESYSMYESRNIAISSNTKIKGILKDRNSNIWLAVYQYGIVIIPESSSGFISYSFNKDNLLGINSSCITSIAESKEQDKLIYVGTDGDGLFIISKDDRVTGMNRDNSNLSDDSVLSLEVDNSGRLWIGTSSKGLQTYSAQEGFKEFIHNNDFKSSVIMTMEYDEESELLYVNSQMDGVYAIDTKTNRIIGRIEGVPAGECRSLYIDSNRVLWIGTLTMGPLYYDAQSGKAKKYEIYEKWQNQKVYDFLESMDGNFWIGYSQGLLQVDRNTNDIKVWTENDGMHDHVIRGILEDTGGDIWVSTLSGISKLNPQNRSVINFYEYDGLQGNEFKNGSAFISSDSRMFFGGANGLTAFYPNLLKLNSHKISGIHLSSLKVLNQNIKYSSDRIDNFQILDKHLYLSDNIHIPRNCSSISFGFSTLEFTNPMRIKFDYMMTKCDDYWHTTDVSNSATYNKLKAGKHILKIRAYYEGDEKNFAYKEFSVHVQKPLYISFPAILCYLTLLAIAIYAVIRTYRSKKRRKHERMEADMNRSRVEMFSNLTHEIRTPLFLVLSPLKQLRETENDSLKKETYNLMYRNGLRINRIVNQFLDLRKVDEGKMKMHFKETDIIYMINDIINSFDNFRQMKHIKVSTLFPESFSLWVDQGNFDKIIFNILSNAFKFTPENGSICIDVRSSERIEGKQQMVDIIISNDGSHIKEEDLGTIFNRFYQSGQSSAYSGSGIGLSLTKMLVELHHGRIWADNTPEGVSFTIQLPYGKSHLSEEELSPTDHHKGLYDNIEMNDKHFVSEFQANEGNTAEKSRESKNNRRIVIVDDDADTREYIKSFFNDYTVYAFKNGEEAWNTISTKKIDAVITDLNMDEMDGFNLCKKIKNTPHTSEIPVIILTSSDEENCEQKCADMGADKYFTKPVSTKLIKSSVAQEIYTRESIRKRIANHERYDYGTIQINSYDKLLKSKIINIIKENLDNPDFGVQELSESIGISRVHLNRRLKDIMGISPSILIKNSRLKQAAYLLINSEQPNISEIAYKVGFSTQSYFSTAFHDYFGQTPSEFILEYNNTEKSDELNHIFE